MPPKQGIIFKLIDGLSRALNGIGMAVIFLLMLLTVADVILRKVFSKGILGTLELSEFMMLAIVFFSMAAGELYDRNVKVDLFVQRLSSRSRAAIDVLIKTIGFALYFFITAAVFGYARMMQLSSEVSFDLLLPKYPFVYVVAVVLIIFCLVLLLRLITAYREARNLWTR